MATFETGLSSHSANDVALTISNDGDVYRAYKANITGAAKQAIVAAACLKYGRRQYGLSFDSAELAECITYVISVWHVEG